MTNGTTLPHERLIAYQAARELLVLVRAAGISNPRLRDQALDAAGSVCLNIAEATGRSGNADQKRVYAIARGEVCEVGAAMDVLQQSALARRRQRTPRSRLRAGSIRCSAG